MMNRISPGLVTGGCLVCGLCTSMTVQALEGGVSPFPAGSTGEYIAAMPPVPGIFAIQQFNHSSADGLRDDDGNRRPIPFDLSAASATTRLLASHAWKLAGAHTYSQFVLPLVRLRVDVAGRRQRDSGLSNLTLTPLILRWPVAPHANISFGLDIVLPNGSYHAGRPSVAVGYTSWQPVLAFRYRNPNGLDAGISNRWMINRTNRDTGYRSGQTYVADFTLGWNVSRWKFGVVGAWLNQFDDDRSNGQVIPANRARSVAIGPSIAYDAGSFHLNLNYQRGIHAANTARQHAAWLNVAFPIRVTADHR